MTEYLSTEQLWLIAQELGVPDVRDIGMLDSAAHRPATGLFSHEAYPTIHLKAAALLESIARNHSLVDGNKRLAWTAAVVFYGLNGFDVAAPHDDAYNLVIGVRTGAIDYRASAETLALWTRPANGPS